MNTIALPVPKLLKTRCLSFSSFRFYIASIILISGNVLFPVLLHNFGNAGQIFLPLYFFSLMGGLAYGWRVGLTVGAFSPLMSFWLTGMPLMPALQFVILKSAILGFFCGYMSERLSQRNLFSISLLAIGFMQLVGIATIFLITRSWQMAMADMIIGYPGLILMQTLGAPIAKKLHSYEGQTPTRNHS